MWWFIIALLAVCIIVVVIEYVTEYWDEFSHKAQHKGTYQFWPKEIEGEVHNSGRRVHQTAWTA